MFPSRKRKAVPKASALYSWQADRKAGCALIQHHIARAVIDKSCALSRTDDVLKTFGTMALEAHQKLCVQSVKQIARANLEYHRLRAFMPGAYAGWPGDQLASDLWHQLSA